MASVAECAANAQLAFESAGPPELPLSVPASTPASDHDPRGAIAVVESAESRAAWKEHVRGWLDDLQPVGAREELAALEIVNSAWKIHRLTEVERNLIDGQVKHERTRRELKDPHDPQALEARSGEPFARACLLPQGKLADQLLRAQREAKRDYARALRDLDKRQAMRSETARPTSKRTPKTSETRDAKLDAPTYSSTISGDAMVDSQVAQAACEMVKAPIADAATQPHTLLQSQGTAAPAPAASTPAVEPLVTRPSAPRAEAQPTSAGPARPVVAASPRPPAEATRVEPQTDAAAPTTTPTTAALSPEQLQKRDENQRRRRAKQQKKAQRKARRRRR